MNTRVHVLGIFCLLDLLFSGSGLLPGNAPGGGFGDICLASARYSAWKESPGPIGSVWPVRIWLASLTARTVSDMERLTQHDPTDSAAPWSGRAGGDSPTAQGHLGSRADTAP